MRKLVAILVGVAAVAAVVAACVAVAHAQSPEPTAVVVAQPAAPSFTGTGADITWPALAGYAVNRFLTVLERMVTDTRSWLDRVLDITKGRIKIDYRKTNIQTWAEEDPDRTGPIPQHNRRRTDSGRNGTAPHDDEPTPQ